MNESTLDVNILYEIMGRETLEKALIGMKHHIQTSQNPSLKIMADYQIIHKYYVSKFGELPEIKPEQKERMY